MNIFLISSVIIASIIMVGVGYLIPYIVLQYYAIKRKVTVKSLSFVAKKYSNLSEHFGWSKFIASSVTLVFILLIYADSIQKPLPYNDIVYGCVLVPLLVIGLLLYIIGGGIKTSIDFADNNLRKQPIKF